VSPRVKRRSQFRIKSADISLRPNGKLIAGLNFISRAATSKKKRVCLVSYGYSTQRNKSLKAKSQSFPENRERYLRAS
jgi:hypothetical protein